MNAKPALVKPCFASDLDPLAALWITRICCNFVEAIYQLNEGVFSEDLRRLIGIAPTEGNLAKAALRPILKTRADELAQQLPRRKTILARNVELLGELLGLDGLQKEILTFVALSKHHQLLTDVVDNIRTSNIDAIRKLLSAALKVREADISSAIQPNGQLLITRIVCIEPSYAGADLKFILPHSLGEAMFYPAGNIHALMDAFLETSPPPNLKADAFAHLAKETELLSAYLSKAVISRTPGVNIMIYGPPGTGKTEYARWLAAHQRKRLYQVKATDAHGGPISSHDRLAFFLLSQAFLQKGEAIILFDEIEDVFPSGESPPETFFRPRPVAGKLFINRLLESNPVPAIWISNAVDHIDKAYLRRFDFSFEMGIPPIAVRRGILQKYLRGHAISNETINYLSQQEQLSPAQVETATKVLNLSDAKPEDKEATLLLVVENGMALLEQEKIDPILSLAESYQLDFLNPDCDLVQLVAQLKQAPDSAGALCFYGAPGTGKTALAHYIAREIELPLLVRRASDILSPYVGETEQQIAMMFKQAKQDGALLLLDEADSFLTERKSAKNSWEVTAVNEMLTQMERFDGLFICSTNLMQRLDEASLRRFALKIKFDYLRPEQRWQLFLAQAQKFHRSREAAYRAALYQLNNLTPGDFATVRRQAALLNITLTADELLPRLQRECLAKRNSGSRQIGFIHHP